MGRTRDAAGDDSLVWPVVPPACRKYRLSNPFPVRSQHLCFFRPWLREDEGSECAGTGAGVLPASSFSFLSFDELGLPMAVGAMDPGELSCQLQVLGTG